MKHRSTRMALVGACLLGAATGAVAQPLVTGDLAVYYDFEGAWVDVVPDMSGNGFDGFILRGGSPGAGRVFPSTEGVRGLQSAVFDPLGIYRPEVVTPAPDPTALPDDGILLGTNEPVVWGPALTVAAYLKLDLKTPYCEPACAGDQDQTIVEIRSAFGSAGTQVEAHQDGQVRAKLRGPLPSENINDDELAFRPPCHQPWPTGQWFHLALTYDSNATFDGQPGHWIIYYDGEIVTQNYANGTTDGFPTGAIDVGGWGQGGFIGHGADDDRQLNGYLDELYIFTRALSSEEINTLVMSGPRSCKLGDVNLDRSVNGLDVDPFVAQVICGVYRCEADTNEDCAVNGLDVESFVNCVTFGQCTTPTPVPAAEPSTLLLGVLGLLFCRCNRRYVRGTRAQPVP